MIKTWKYENGVKDGYSVYNTYMSQILSSTRPNWLFYTRGPNILIEG